MSDVAGRDFDVTQLRASREFPSAVTSIISLCTLFMNSHDSTLSAPSTLASNEDKTTAVVSYLTLIGFVAAIVIHSSKKTSLGSYHLRQSLGLMITSIGLVMVGMIIGRIPFLGWMVELALWLGLIALWFTGLLAAASGERKPVAVLGEHFQKWFGRAFE
jgi:uncharacterized membrane protein